MFSAIAVLRSMLSKPAPMPPRTHVSPEKSRIMETIRTIGIETLAASSDHRTSTIARSAISDGRDVILVGCSPFKIVACDGRWSAETLIGFEGDPMRYRTIIEGEGDRIVACRPADMPETVQ